MHTVDHGAPFRQLRLLAPLRVQHGVLGRAARARIADAMQSLLDDVIALVDAGEFKAARSRASTRCSPAAD